MAPTARNERGRLPARVLARRWGALLTTVTVVVALLVSLTGTTPKASSGAASHTTTPVDTKPLPRPAPSHSPCPAVTDPLPGMPPVNDPCDIYAADGAGDLAPAAQSARPLVYVPNSLNDTVDEIDPSTYKVVGEFGVGALPQHVVPSWDLKTLWVTNDQGNSLTPIDPVTGDPGTPVHVEDPYNLYFTPDGRYAVVVAEALERLDFRDPQTMSLIHSLPVPCHGVDHMDFSANGRYLIASCEFSGKLLKVDVTSQTVVGTLDLPAGSEPQDVKLSPDGTVFYVADLKAAGVWEVDGDAFKVLGLLPTGRGAHGLYVSRNAQDLYVANRDVGTVSVVSFASRQVVATWMLPPESGTHLGSGSNVASPDMGGVSADGSVLWLSGRYDSDVYAIDTATGQQIARVPVGLGPHGVCVWPQPGRYSLGHTGILR